jgi:hypothetical protein
VQSLPERRGNGRLELAVRPLRTTFGTGHHAPARVAECRLEPLSAADVELATHSPDSHCGGSLTDSQQVG